MARQRHSAADKSAFAGLGLSPMALKAVGDLGYAEPTPVQRQAIPAVLAGKDVMAAAQTGTGKTAAFLLPVMDGLARGRRGEGPRMLVVTPTRELAAQIAEVAQAICVHTHHRVTTVVGGVGYEPQKQALKRGCDILVATPGRLIDLMEQDSAHLDGVEVLVLDEADRMLDMGFLPSVRKIVAATPKTRQTLLFSATLGPDVLKGMADLVRDPVRVDIAPKGTAAETVEQYVLAVAPEAKKRVLTQVLALEGAARVIVFVRGKHRADHLCRVLRRKGVSAQAIHGDRSQNQRARALAEFATGEVDVLVATDVLARGIDIEDVAYVMNLDVPHEAEDYIHRIGRTGRAEKTGWALTVCTEEEYLDLRDIEQLMGKVIPEYPRANELDAGESGGFLDPARNPKDKLPSKKVRKKLAKRRAEKADVPARTERAVQTDTDAKSDGAAMPSEAKRADEGAKTDVSTTPARANRKGGTAKPRGKSDAKPRGKSDAKPRGKSGKKADITAASMTARRRRGEVSAQASETTTRQSHGKADKQAPRKSRKKPAAQATRRADAKPNQNHATQVEKKRATSKVRRRPGDRRGMMAQRG